MRGRELVGEVGRDWCLLPIVLLRELPRLRCGVPKLESEFWRSSAGKSSPKTFCRRLWKFRPMLDLEPVLLTVVALATDGRLSSFMGKPMLSSLVPVPGRKPGDDWETSSFESLKKLLQTLLVMLFPLGAVDQGATCELALEAVGGLRDMDGTRPPEVSRTASCFRWWPKALGVGASQLAGLRGRCEGLSLGGGAGGTVPGDISDSRSTLWRVSSRSVVDVDARVGVRQARQARHVSSRVKTRRGQSQGRGRTARAATPASVHLARHQTQQHTGN